MTEDYRALLARRGDTHWWVVGMRRIVLELAGPLHGRVLDVGCGPGWHLGELPPGATGVGLDRDAAHVFYRPLVQGDAGRLPFADHSFDRVLALDLLDQRAVQPPAALSEMSRVLRPGGLLVLRVPANPWLHGPHDEAWGGVRRFSYEQLAGLVRGAGLTPKRLTYANTLLFPAAVASRLLARAGVGGGDDLHILPDPLNRVMLSVLNAEARWLRRHDFPFGLSLLCTAKCDASPARSGPEMLP